MFRSCKSLSIMFITILVLSLALAGCGSDKKSSGSSSGSDDGDPYEIVMAYMSFTNLDDIKTVEEEISKLTKEKINATVTLLPIQAGAWQQQTNLMLTSDEKLDLIMTSSLYNYNSQAVKGQLIPIDELLDSHGQGILDVVPAHMVDASRVEGKVYGIPGFRDWAADYGFVMRKDLVDKYNIDLSQVKTMADLGAVFKVIEENESTIDPVVGGTIPQLTGYIYPFFDELGGTVGALDVTKEDFKVINQFEHPAYKEGADLVREWFKAGYIMKDAATSEDAAVNIVKAGKGFGYFNNMKPGYELQEQGLSGYEMVAVRFTEPHQFTTNATSFMMSIAKNSKNPEKAMEFFNLLYTDEEIMNLLALGVEGKHYEVNEEGFVTLPEGVTETGYTFNQWMIGNNFITKIWDGQGADYWDEMMAFNESAIASPAFGFTFNADPVKTEIAAVSNVIEQYSRGIGTGTLDPAKSIPEFQEKLKAAGANKIIEEKQKQLDEWKANK